MLSDLQKHQLKGELLFSTSRSSGPGGQHVNKVNTKVELRFCLEDTTVLNEKQKSQIFSKLAYKLTQNKELIITVQSSRSQLKNKQEAIQKFLSMINDALIPIKIRKPTNPTQASKQKRIENKKVHSLKKNLRKKPEL